MAKGDHPDLEYLGPDSLSHLNYQQAVLYPDREAGISDEDSGLTWHSIRHSTGRYEYNQLKDFELVAEILRHSTLEVARPYTLPTPESKQDVIEAIQGGGGS